MKTCLATLPILKRRSEMGRRALQVWLRAMYRRTVRIFGGFCVSPARWCPFFAVTDGSLMDNRWRLPTIGKPRARSTVKCYIKQDSL